MTPTPEQLLSDFVDAWNAGRRPDVRAYLQRLPSGADRDELAEQIGQWLEIAPTPRYDAAARTAIRADPVVQQVFTAVGEDAGRWPQILPALRERSRLSVGELAVRLAERLGLAQPETQRAASYLERLEGGELEASRISRRLVDALADVLGVSAGAFADAGPFGRGMRPATAGGTLFRRDESGGDWVAQDIELLSEAAFAPAPADELDAVDRLFLGGPDA